MGAPAGWRAVDFVLIRHGQTSWNAEGIIQGQSDAPLDDVGRTQARLVGNAVASGRFGSVRLPIRSSDLSRAADTAAAVAAALGATDDDVAHHPELRERHMGLLQGVPRRDVREDPTHARAWRAFQSGDDAARVPGGGESFDDLWDRTVGFVERLAIEAAETRHDDPPRLPIVTHGGVIHVFADRCRRDAGAFVPATGADEDARDARNPGDPVPVPVPTGVVRNCSVHVVRVHVPPRDARARGDEPMWETVSWGDDAHLAGVAEGLPHGFGGTRDSA